MKLATTIAKISQAATSPIAPAASASVPIAVPVRPRSLRMRASIGKAVIDSEAPRNSAAWLAVIDSLKKPPFECSRIAHAAAKRERRQDPRQRHRCRLPDGAPQQIALELEADREHVERQRDLRQAVDARHGVGAEQPGRRVGSQPPEERGPEQEARHHLRDDLGLTELAGRPRP